MRNRFHMSHLIHLHATRADKYSLTQAFQRFTIVESQHDRAAGLLQPMKDAAMQIASEVFKSDSQSSRY